MGISQGFSGHETRGLEGTWQRVVEATSIIALGYLPRPRQAIPAMAGCVTTGEDWQFLRLVGNAVTIDQGRFYIDNVGGILAALRMAIQQAANI